MNENRSCARARSVTDSIGRFGALVSLLLAAGCGVTFQAGDRIDLDGDGFFAMADPASYNVGLDINDDAARDSLRQTLLDLQLDCNDANDDINPQASELCDGLDNDCDGFRDVPERDLDGDGFTPCGVDPASTELIGADCNDARPPEVVDPTSAESLAAFVAPFQNPNRTEVCGFPMLELDGWTRSGVIIGDTGASIRPAIGIDDDCDGEILSGEVDSDRDGHYRGCEAVLMEDPAVAPDPGDVLAADCLDNEERVYPTVGAADARCTDFRNADGLRVDTQCDPELTPNSPANDDYEDDGINWYADADGDEDGDPLDIQNVCLGGDPDPGRISEDALNADPLVAPSAADCNDQDAKLYSYDSDLDGVSPCGPDGIQNTGDEDYLNGQSFDSDSDVYPGNSESCDGKDNNLNGQTDEGFDGDGDGSFDAANVDCAARYGIRADCNDSSPLLNGNDVDNDGSSTCAGDCDDGNPGISQTDADGDGWFTCPTDIDNDGTFDGVDCDDSDPTLNQDNVDSDPFSSCDGDCDDNNPAVGPHNSVECDGIADTNCDGVFDPLEVDNDGDGSSECDGDCNDANAGLNLTDNDSDGSTTCSGDCNDNAPTVRPGAPSACDGILDNDCNNVADANEADADGDGYVICPGTGTLPAGALGGGDCNDHSAFLTSADADGDGLSTCAGDCDDSNPALSPLVDVDQDGWSTCAVGAQPADCDDSDPVLNESDSDNDSDSTCAGDCDDSNPRLNTLDVDGDGVDSCAGDCDDGPGGASKVPGETEVLDGIDNDCDGVADEGLLATGNLVIVEMMISGGANVADGAAEYIEIINTRAGQDIDLRGVTVTIDNVVPNPASPGTTTTESNTYSFASSPTGMSLTVLRASGDRVALGRSAALDGANLTTGNPNATYAVGGTAYVWQAGLLSDLGGTIALRHGGILMDQVTWFPSGCVTGCSGSSPTYNLNQDVGAALDRSRWRPGYSMGLQSITGTPHVANDNPAQWCEEQTAQGSGLFGTPAAAPGVRVCS